MQYIGLDPHSILHRAGHVSRKLPFLHILVITLRAGFDLCIDVVDHFFEDNVDPGASFLRLARDITEILSADLTRIDQSDLSGLCGAGK